VPLKKVLFRPGVNRENTRYATESLGQGGSLSVANATAGWYDCDKVRFRQGTPEKIGGWERISSTTYQGTCRSLWNWVTLAGQNLLGVGTNLKFYIEQGGAFYDITPIRGTATLNNPFDTVNASPTVVVNDVAHGCITGDFVTFSGASAVAGLDLNNEYQVTVTGVDTYTITAAAAANATVTGGGGAAVTATYQITTGPAYAVPLVGWGAGPWGFGSWGVGSSTTDALRLWSQSNFGQNLIFGPRGGAIYYWDATTGVTSRGVDLTTVVGANQVPTVQNYILVSDISRFVMVFGTNDVGSAVQDPMLVRWSDQEDATNWEVTATTQAGSLRLSHGSKIVTALQARQEVLVWTDSSVYSMQYVGAPVVWGAQLVGENISIVSQNAVAYAGGTAYWMGADKFYKYDGRTQTLRCDLRQYIFGDLNKDQFDQVCSGTNEGFNEVWWFYCSADAVQNDRYAVYNYLEDVWYYGQLSRSAWLDSGLRPYPIAAATEAHVLVNHETGVDDRTLDDPVPIEAYITSAEFDLDDGHNFMFVWRMLPDTTFRGSTAAAPQLTMSLLPLKNSGSGYTNPASIGGSNSATVTQTVAFPIEEFTGQVYTRVRARQMALRVGSTALGVTWQLGAPRLDMRPDGRR
jgi:hypothetical protein